MSNKKLRAGTAYVRSSSGMLKAKGHFTYNLGGKNKKAQKGVDGVHGYGFEVQEAFIEGEITVDGNTDVKKIKDEEGTVQLDLENGKTIVLRDAWNESEGTVETEENKLPVRWVSVSEGEEIK
ncbi:phage tail tube protein [Halobacteriovorax sp. GB3]|uniref:phage tail tube protein n=1 Tax=Halobacteriovorax sp. GB3 TaxID=2719615 RepID=UPI002362721F|nr:phage tail tube protein [Halobacteriovorax sp. GB3]MDD0852995.1 phage tail tube protein [Halobacteriovorax sp. GB3]